MKKIKETMYLRTKITNLMKILLNFLGKLNMEVVNPTIVGLVSRNHMKGSSGGSHSGAIKKIELRPLPLSLMRN